MKTATFPSLRVDPELRDAAESVLEEGESLSNLIETSVREAIMRRRNRAQFMARGLAAREEYARAGVFFTADEVHADLKRSLDAAKKRIRG